MTPLTCKNCGKTNITSGLLNCPSCGANLIIRANAGVVGSGSVLLDRQGRQYKLSASLVTLIGSKGCAILLSDPGIPSTAARLTPNAGGFIIEDLSGLVILNGARLSMPTVLNNGDMINIGSVELSYSGPSSSVNVPKTQQTYPLAPTLSTHTNMPLLQNNNPPPVKLKNWGRNPPLIEGSIEIVDGPHHVEKGNLFGKLAASALLGMISSSLVGLPFWMRQEVMVWYLRVKAYPSGKICAVVIRGEPGSLPQMSDFIAIWGIEESGNILMKQGYNYTTDSYIPIKK